MADQEKTPAINVVGKTTFVRLESPIEIPGLAPIPVLELRRPKARDLDEVGITIGAGGLSITLLQLRKLAARVSNVDFDTIGEVDAADWINVQVVLIGFLAPGLPIGPTPGG